MSEKTETPEKIAERFKRALENLRKRYDARLPIGQLTIYREERPER